MHRILFCAIVTCLLADGLIAQSNGNSTSSQWQSLKNKGDPITTINVSDANGRAQGIAAYVADADALKSFYTQNPNDPEAKEAQRREALALLYAQSLGDTSQKGRCKQLVTQLRKDASIDVELREQLAAFSDNLDTRAQPTTSVDQQVSNYEQTARALQAEFAGSSSIYESLNGIATSSPDDRAAKIAHDILTMPAPDQAKARAQILLNRLALKGASLTDLATSVLGSNNPVTAGLGHPIVVYSWSTAVPQVIAILKNLSSSLPADTVYVGVCLDLGDLSAARAYAASVAPPGQQIYDPMGYIGKFAGRAQLTAPVLIYVADRKGVVVSVSAQRDPSALVSLLSNL